VFLILIHTDQQATLPVSSRGVLVSCIGGKEQYAAKDSIRILTEVLSTANGTQAADMLFTMNVI